MPVEPLLILRENRFSYTSESRQPMSLRVFEDRVECTKPRLIARGSTDTIRYEQIAQVIVHQGLVWSALAIETNGGGGFRIGGLKKHLAEEAKAAIDAHVAQVQASTTPPASLAEQLVQLTSLRDSGALSEAEFGAAKKRLIGED
jgi:hypothetical protein